MTNERASRFADAPLVRVDRLGYSGSIHAASDGEEGLWTLCGRQVGVHWRVSVSAFDAAQVDCKLCRRFLDARQ